MPKCVKAEFCLPCDLCGEMMHDDECNAGTPSTKEIGEFWDETRGEGNESVLAHGECGIAAGLELA